jgi:hypothetical protein
MDEEIECLECGWMGFFSELQCSDADMESNKNIEECLFNICPGCGAADSCEDCEE